MTSATANTYEKKARLCRDSVESVSLMRSKVLDTIEGNLSGLTKRFVKGYEDFCMWEARLRANWAKDPTSYEEVLHRELDRIASLWMQCGSMLHDLLCWAEEEHLTIEFAKKANAIYASMLSIEIMDVSPLPDHLAKLAEEAESKWKARTIQGA